MKKKSFINSKPVQAWCAKLAYPWTPDYTLSGSMSDCLNIPNFAFVYIGM